MKNANARVSVDFRLEERKRFNEQKEKKRHAKIFVSEKVRLKLKFEAKLWPLEKRLQRCRASRTSMQTDEVNVDALSARPMLK